ncbi:HNH endonuclease signature motif containing protein [Mesorhizobium sp. SP-1A]|uniref:HNH endonuclease n=1 Tax=Mesorhizobium sp. SP-1A TaxID=3077840 RepID=UPI0028F6DB8D|nr:HNH endonuclease signature motif containing protein [Mesorhizobium sp. SP-1A]
MVSLPLSPFIRGIVSKYRNKQKRNKLENAFFKATRVESLTTFDNKCAYCYDRLTSRTVTADHFKARSKGGLDHAENIVPACRPCNRLKGSMTAGEFKKRIKGATYMKDGLDWVLTKVRRNINIRLDHMEERVMRAVRGTKVKSYE